MSKALRARNARVVAGAITLAVALSTAAIALATAPNKGWTYTTHSTTTVYVSFKVSASGTKVINLSAGIAVKCKGSAGGFPSAKPGSGRITNGTFKVVLKLFPPGAAQKSNGTDTVTGKFVTGGKAIGAVLTHFNGQNSKSFCRGVKQSYTAIGMA